MIQPQKHIYYSYRNKYYPVNFKYENAYNVKLDLKTGCKTIYTQYDGIYVLKWKIILKHTN